ncbi:MAG: beta-propeller fold lactonase family protein [Micropruina sp.]|uniref:lactonase family protein n=1 Tax=Micropruina sp. TaxID=2737536 RepID=UPI0039E5EEA4
MTHRRISLWAAAAAAALALASAPAPAALAGTVPESHPAPAPDRRAAGAVFVQTDDLTSNAVIAFDRDADGRLRHTGSYPTGGRGATLDGAVVDPLASQGSLTLDSRHGLLFAVNGGSDTITVFGVDGSRLVRRQILPSRGDLPVSVSVAGDLVYVLNARAGGSISGYRIAGRTVLPLPGSTRNLHLTDNANPEFLQSPAQVAVTPDQHAVVVSTKTHGTLLTYPLWRGVPSATPTTTASGAVPFALSFDRAGRLLVVDATGLATSYRLGDDGRLRQLSQAGPTGQQAACWTVLVRGTLYAANAGSDSISSFAVRHGRLGVRAATAAATDGGPVDLATSRQGEFLYQLSGADGTVDAYRIARDGSLTRIGSTSTGLGAGNARPVEGIAAS